MLIVCPSCASEYTLDPERIGDGGRKVRCAVCRTTWFAHRPEPDVPAETLSADPSPRTIEAMPHQTGSTAGARKSPVRRPPPVPSGRTRDRLALGVVVFALLAIPTAFALRHQVVRQVPGSASLFAAAGLGVNLVGLELADVTAELGQDGSARTLVIEGEIRSIASRPVSIPRLDFAIEGKERDGLYRWSVKPPVAELGPGESARFTAKLASPPPAGARFVASFQQPSNDQSVALR